MVQEGRPARASLAGWLFVPALRKATWSEACELVAAAPKPLLVAPLVEPGHLVMWSVDALDEVDRAVVVRELASLQQFCTEKLRLSGVGPTGSVRLHGPDAEMVLTIDEFARWLREFVMAGVGLIIRPTDESGVVRLLLLPPGGAAPPLGDAES